MTKRIIIASITTVISLALTLIMQVSVASAAELTPGPTYVTAPTRLTQPTYIFEPVTVITGFTIDTLPIVPGAGEIDIDPPSDGPIEPSAPADEPDTSTEEPEAEEEPTTTTQAPESTTTTQPTTTTQAPTTTTQAAPHVTEAPAVDDLTVAPSVETPAAPTTRDLPASGDAPRSDDTSEKISTSLGATTQPTTAPAAESNEAEVDTSPTTSAADAPNAEQAIEFQPVSRSTSDQAASTQYLLLGISLVLLAGAGALIKSA